MQMFIMRYVLHGMCASGKDKKDNSVSVAWHLTGKKVNIYEAQQNVSNIMKSTNKLNL